MSYSSTARLSSPTLCTFLIVVPLSSCLGSVVLRRFWIPVSFRPSSPSPLSRRFLAFVIAFPSLRTSSSFLLPPIVRHDFLRFVLAAFSRVLSFLFFPFFRLENLAEKYILPICLLCPLATGAPTTMKDLGERVSP